MKILSNKNYYQLMGKIETLSKDNECLQRKIDEMKEEKPIDCKSNEGSQFCNICQFGYLKLRLPLGTDVYGCGRTIPCESFERKESE